MYPVLLAQWMKDKRKPYLILLFIFLSILATIIFGNVDQYEQKSVPIFSSETNASEIEEKWDQLLNGNSEIEFVIMKEEEARDQVSTGKSDVAVRLMEDDYRLIVASDFPTIHLVEQEVKKVFTKEARISAAANTRDIAEVRKEVNDVLENPPIQVDTLSLSGDELPSYNMGMQLLFGFTLFIAMFTIGFKVNGVNADKVNGIWNRMILSPVSKTNMYVGHLLYSYCIGLFQMVTVFLIFRYIMKYDIGNLSMILVIAAVYTLSMVSVAMLIAGIAKTPEKFNMIFPSIIPIIPIISGVYMPPGTIDNAVLNFIAKIFPLSHGVEAMMDVAIYNAGWNDITFSLIFMLLIAVVCMGIGINLVERQKG
ncbi:MAG TPA: ABC transporter permease [Bacillaceae bacterium]|nr:ABC transporter permease [Paenibacillus bovis]HLU21798.1 ABC transporter permease [Bacillaceae bacterium]